MQHACLNLTNHIARPIERRQRWRQGGCSRGTLDTAVLKRRHAVKFSRNIHKRAQVATMRFWSPRSSRWLRQRRLARVRDWRTDGRAKRALQKAGRKGKKATRKDIRGPRQGRLDFGWAVLRITPGGVIFRQGLLNASKD